MSIRAFIWISVGALLTIFVFQNAATVEIRLLFWTVSMSRVLLLGGALIVGFAAGFAVAWEFLAKKKHADKASFPKRSAPSTEKDHI